MDWRPMINRADGRSDYVAEMAGETFFVLREGPAYGDLYMSADRGNRYLGNVGCYGRTDIDLNRAAGLARAALEAR